MAACTVGGELHAVRPDLNYPLVTASGKGEQGVAVYGLVAAATDIRLECERFADRDLLPDGVRIERSLLRK